MRNAGLAFGLLYIVLYRCPLRFACQPKTALTAALHSSNQDKGGWPHLLNDGVDDAAKNDQRFLGIKKPWKPHGSRVFEHLKALINAC